MEPGAVRRPNGKRSMRDTPTSRDQPPHETGGSHALDKEVGSLRALKWSPAGTSPQCHDPIRALRDLRIRFAHPSPPDRRPRIGRLSGGRGEVVGGAHQRPSSSEGDSGSALTSAQGAMGVLALGAFELMSSYAPLHRRPRLSQRPSWAYHVDNFRITLCVWSKKRFAASR
jgi:hypothetical protein